AESVYGTRCPAFARWMKGATPTERRQGALLRSYALFRFLPSRVKILDESDFGGAVFIIASVRRNPNRDGPFRIELVWEATERLVARRGDGRRGGVPQGVEWARPASSRGPSPWHGAVIATRPRAQRPRLTCDAVYGFLLRPPIGD